MRRNIILMVLLVAATLTASAQSDVLSVEFTGRQPDASLGGHAAVVFHAESDDYVIESTINEQCPAPRRVSGGYEYRMVIDLKGSSKESRTFIVKKRGTPFEGKSPQKNVVANNVSTYVITEMKTKIGGNEVVNGNTYFGEEGNKPVLACIEVTVPQELALTVNVNKALAAQVSQTTSAGNIVYKIVFDTNRFDALQQAVNKLEQEKAALDTQIDKAASEAEKEKLFKRQDDLDAQLESARADAENAPVITIGGKDVNTLTIDPTKITSLTPKDKLIFGVVVVEKEVMREYSFEELLALARERYKDYPKHTDFVFYEGALTAYDNVTKHKDCPDAMRTELKAERDSIVQMRYLVHYYEKFLADANAAEKNSEVEYKNLAAALRAVNRLLKYHPEITPFNSIKQDLRTRVRQHPMGKHTVQRQVVSGRISFADPSMADPFNTMSVYSSPTEKVDHSRSRKLGGVNSDGTYRVVIPDNVIYIYVSGEKKAHYIGNGTKQLDIVVD